MNYSFDTEEIDTLIECDATEFAVNKINELNIEEMKSTAKIYPFMIRHSPFANDRTIREIAIKSDFRVICTESFEPTEDEINLCLAMLDEYGEELNYNSVDPYDLVWVELKRLLKDNKRGYDFIEDLVRLEKLKEI